MASPGPRKLWFRLAFTLVASALWVLILWAMTGNGFAPEGNPLPGPLWLLQVRSQYDKWVGAIACSVLLPAMFAVGIWTNWATVVLSLLGVAGWVGFGMFLGRLAVV